MRHSFDIKNGFNCIWSDHGTLNTTVDNPTIVGVSWHASVEREIILGDRDEKQKKKNEKDMSSLPSK